MISLRETLLFGVLLATHLPSARCEFGREPLITPAAFLPARAQQCATSTATPCPDGLGCCPSGYPCTYVSFRPVCDKPCGAVAVRCTQGGCCSLGSSCQPGLTGLCTAMFNGIVIPSIVIPSLVIPTFAVPTFVLPTIPSIPTTLAAPTIIQSATKTAVVQQTSSSSVSVPTVVPMASQVTTTTSVLQKSAASVATTSLPVQQSAAAAAAVVNQPRGLGMWDVVVVGVVGFLGFY